jgi:hypothetical protein
VMPLIVLFAPKADCIATATFTHLVTSAIAALL